MDPLVSNIIISLCVVLLTIVFYLIYQRSKSAKRYVLLTGVCDTGKTLMFARLVHDKFVNSHTSIQENIGEYTTEKGSVTIVDIPGHERLRNKFVEQYKKMTVALIYVVDSSRFKTEIRDVAEYLYTLLTDATIASSCNRILILCNKQDLPLAKGITVIKQLLEKELTTVRMTKASQLSSTEEGDSKNSVSLGDENSDFEFSQCSHYRIDLAEGYSVDAEGGSEAPYDLKAVENWLLNVV